MSKNPDYFLLENAEGTIEARDEQYERLDEFTERVGSGEFHVTIDEIFPSGCIDGRSGCSLKPNIAGGTLGVAVADDLVNKQFRGNDDSLLAQYRNVAHFLRKTNRPIGGHDDAHANDEKSGCGAADRLPEIYEFMARNPELLRGLTESLGVKVDENSHALITENARNRTEFSSGAEIRDELREQAHGDFDHLKGEHNEVIAVMNKRPRTTLDRDALEVEFGSDYEAFNFDLWALPDAANAISTTNDSPESEAKQLAMIYYTLATAHVLCGKNMRVMTLS